MSTEPTTSYSGDQPDRAAGAGTPAPDGAAPQRGPGGAVGGIQTDPVLPSDKAPDAQLFRPEGDVELEAGANPPTSPAWEPGRQVGLPSDYDHTGAYSALVIGETLVDVVTSAGDAGEPTTAEHPGGSPANVALGLGRLGRDVELVTSFGADARGQRVRGHLEAAQVRLAKGAEGGARTSVAQADVDRQGVASYTFDLLWDPPAPQPMRAPLVLHTGSIGAVLEPGAAVVRDAVERYRETATITYDPNARPALMGTPGDVLPSIEWFVAHADVVKVSADDVAWLVPGEDYRSVARRWLALGPALVIVTLGGEGAWAVSQGGAEVSVAAPPVTVVDTVGAGDAFMAGTIDGLWQAELLGAERRDALRGIASDELARVLEHAAKVAAITVSRAGANPPSRPELQV